VTAEAPARPTPNDEPPPHLMSPNEIFHTPVLTYSELARIRSLHSETHPWILGITSKPMTTEGQWTRVVNYVVEALRVSLDPEGSLMSL
jgi:hypothetical protein